MSNKIKRQYVVIEPPKKSQIETGKNYKLDNSRTLQYDWHDWFAWYPVNISGKIIWLQTIERKYVYKMNIRENHYMFRLKGSR